MFSMYSITMEACKALFPSLSVVSQIELFPIFQKPIQKISVSKFGPVIYKFTRRPEKAVELTPGHCKKSERSLFKAQFYKDFSSVIYGIGPISWPVLLWQTFPI
jgi:hypothetical protein